ncbi:MAG: glutamate--tRNA ligase [Balneolaceae bacterium]|nr:glutamate--tRNA ligase [Balneolaceae bacterium]MBO6545038.1 glutamate--tRNA ligase [Balneolaceae bacterium]MBO6646434.1 glutamate--tRNA ligase [Balneolaceae bacterium]
MSVRVRFAPSPTGFLHIGGLRTALYNYLFARHHGGTFVLRIEDTDQNRYVEGAEHDIITSLEWAGMTIDEGPHKPGDVGPYRQSERKEMYHKYAKQLVDDGHAYYAFDTTEEIDEMRERLKKSGNPSPSYDSITRQSMKNSLTLPQDEVEKRLAAGDEYVIRLKVPRRETVKFEDLVRGIVSFETAGLDDQVLMKSDGMPTYHLANVVDDHTMGITHVIRGEEWLSSAPKHMLLYKAFGWEPPTMAHLPLIMSPSGGKLSKRKAESEGIPINTKDYIIGNYEPNALINFLAYLGWSPGDDSEIHSMEELCKLFTLDRVSKGGAVFNHKKLMWYNEHYIRESSVEELLVRVKILMQDAGFEVVDDNYLKTVIELLHDRVSKVDEFVSMGAFFYQAPEEYDPNALKKWKDDSAGFVKAYQAKIEEFSEEDFVAANLKSALEETVSENEVGFGKVMMPVRIATTGQGFGPDLFASLELLGKQETLNRIDKALEKLN